jgi:hypothetical protein
MPEASVVYLSENRDITPVRDQCPVMIGADGPRAGT